MRADLSRDTFDPANSYQGVVLQMGRVLLDADFNEQGEVIRHLARTVNRDVVGARGVPRNGGGFEVGVGAGGDDLTISTGRMYVDGLAVDNQPQVVGATVQSATELKLDTTVLDDAELDLQDRLEVVGGSGGPLVVTALAASVASFAPHGLPVDSRVELRRSVSLHHQPFAFRSSLRVDREPLDAGRYVAVLRACLREESAVDRPEIAEVALGGPDSSTRIRLIWEVLLARVGAQGSGSCADWTPPARTARLRPVLEEPDATEGDCALPPDAAFRGSEHRLYRVEVNDVDDAGTITSLLYDTDNASVASLITTLEQNVTLESFGVRGSDGVGGFDNGQTVTVTDRHREWDGVPAQVLTTSNADSARRTLDLSDQPVADAKARPRLRRWTGEFEDVTPGQPVDLGNGLSVEITGEPKVGDYWMIPARSAFGGSGALDWPLDAPKTYRAMPAHGPDEVWAPLAVVDFDGTVFTMPADADCRTEFPPLTAITADDVSYDDTATGLDADTVQEALDKLYFRGGGGCTITVEPGPGWERALADLPDGLDARICFRAGDYPTATRVVIKNKGSLLLQGIGAASFVHATGDEVALSVENCASVSVRDLAFSAEGSQRPGGDGVLGALTVVGCPHVDIEGIVASCQDGTDPRTAALAIVGPAAAPPHPRAFDRRLGTRVMVRDCLLSPGEYQVGLTIRDFDRTDVSGVVVEGPGVTRFISVPTFPGVLRERLKLAMVSGLKTVEPLPGPPVPPLPAPPAPPVGPAGPLVFRGAPGTIKVIESGGFRFETAGRVAQPWRKVLAENPIVASESPIARAHLFELADLAFKPDFEPKLKVLRDAVDAILKTRIPVIAHGIVVGGVRADEVRITGCRVRRAVKGISVALSNRKTSRGMRLRIGRVVVTDSQVDVQIPPEAVGGRHGVYVGHASSVLLADNALRMGNQALQDPIDSAAMRLGGFFGTDIVLRDNHAADFRRGVWLRSNADAAVLSSGTRWLVRGNLFERAETPVMYEPVGYAPGTAPVLRQSENVP